MTDFGFRLDGGAVYVNYGSVASGFLQPDLSKAYNHLLTATAALLIGQPLYANPPPRYTRILIQVLQDGTGSRLITWAPCYRDAPSWGSSGPANSSALAVFIADGQGGYQYEGGSSTFAINAGQMVPGVGAAQYAGTQPVQQTNKIAPTVGAVTLAGVAPTRTP